MSLEDIRAYEQVGENRFREVHGLFYEDVVVGEVVEHRPGRTVTEADNVWGSLLAVNPHPLHIDAAYAETTVGAASGVEPGDAVDRHGDERQFDER